MAASSVLNKMRSMAQSIGVQALSGLYPNDFELYMIALELTDSEDNVIDYLSFPVMPDSIQKTEPTRTNIKKSLMGVTALTNPSFTPQEINIKGTFGRNFKILLNVANPIKGAAFSTAVGKYDLFSVSGRKTTLAFPGFDVGVKTGYGVIKILKAMASKSVALDKLGKPFRLYFYNMALGESFLVVIPPSGVQYSQDISKNMIWNYNLTMITLAPLDAVAAGSAKRSTLVDRLTSFAVQTGVNKLATKVTRAIL